MSLWRLVPSLDSLDGCDLGCYRFFVSRGSKTDAQCFVVNGPISIFHEFRQLKIRCLAYEWVGYKPVISFFYATFESSVIREDTR